MTLVFLAPAPAILYLNARVRHTVEEVPAFGDVVVPYNSIGYEVEDYHVEAGFPVADTAIGIGVPVEVTRGEMTASMSIGEIFSKDLGGVCRWLPVDGSFDDPTSWSSLPAPYVLDADGVSAPRTDYRSIDLETSQTTPELDTGYSYVRDGYPVDGSAMRLQGDDYLSSNALAWSGSFAVLMVVVLGTPQGSAYAIFETYPDIGADPSKPNAIGDPNRSFISIRYASDGSIQTSSLGLQGDRQTTSGGGRVGVPLVVGFLLEQQTLTTVIQDRSPSTKPIHLKDAHPQDARLFIGSSPQMANATAVMDILEIDYFEGLDIDDVLDKATHLDEMYGVST